MSARSLSGQATAAATRSHSCCTTLRRGLLTLFAFAVVLGAGAWLDRDSLLRSAADLWIVSDPLAPADAVAVLGGGVEDRPFAAAQYYKEGLVKKILVSNAYEGPAEKLGIVVPDAIATREILLKLGVPASAIATFGHRLRNTHQEALALRAWAERTGARSLIVPTEIFSTRRVRWVLHHLLPPGTTIRVPALPPPDYSRTDWWRHNRGILAFQNEILKYLYYRIRY
jgi:uncharacterized SAM-binding protein YcdF (DUF218 family)